MIASLRSMIEALFDEVKRLRAIEQTHLLQIRRLEEHLEAKRQHIMRLESHLDKQEKLYPLIEVSSPSESDSQILQMKNVSNPKETKTDDPKEIFHTEKNVETLDDDQTEDDECTKLTENISEIDIKKETQSPLSLDAISQQNAIAAAAAAAAACNNDPNKFQELLMERTKALVAAETLKSSDEIATDRIVQDITKPGDDVEQHVEATKVPKIEVDLDESAKNIENAGSLTKQLESFTNVPRSMKETCLLKSDVEKPSSTENDELSSANFKENVERFGSLLGEDTQTNSSILRSTDTLQHMPPNHQLPSHITDHHEKMGLNQQDSMSASSASTPNLQDQRSNDEHGLSLNGSHKSLDDNNSNLCATPTNPIGPHHLPHSFLPGLPFQFQDRGHFRFADELQLPPGTSMAGRLGESLIPKGDPMEAKLQEMLRYNMDKYANQNLDTMHISRRVRELLSVHNIGQRIFAKYILGLSQGTVSELLSKPKPWEKLTEKGRDSYRKMHAWSCDDNAVMLLKSLIPKKGKLKTSYKNISSFKSQVFLLKLS
uniref:CUT domain-containing protein n=1 Tax=Glossina pallidipes TaxID=7398 RepID=A0A1A9ZRS3_GLOPL